MKSMSSSTSSSGYKEMKEERLICCCGSNGWAKVIGWYQIIISATQIALITWILVCMDLDNLNKKNDVVAVIYLFNPTILIVNLMFEILAFAMALTLLRGSYIGNPRYLQVWVVFTIICVVTVVVFFLALPIIFMGQLFSMCVYTLILWLAIQSFCLWVVIVHRNEMMAEDLARPTLSYRYSYEYMSPI